MSDSPATPVQTEMLNETTSVGSPTPDPLDLRNCMRSADELKQEGNDHFRAQRWDEALAAYKSALGHLPKRPQQSQQDDIADDRFEDDVKETVLQKASEPGPGDHASTGHQEEDQISPSGLEGECAKARAVLNANIGACYVKLGEHKQVVDSCTEALKDDPIYIKALQRRAASNEHLDSWSSLTSAQEDYKTLLQLLPSTSPDIIKIRRSLATLAPRIETAQKRETGEMVDKLKGLGNSILGNFGLSTDNFQFVPNGQGGYSMNFVQNPTQ